MTLHVSGGECVCPQALFQSLERCGQSAQELRVCQLELARHRDSSAAGEWTRNSLSHSILTLIPISRVFCRGATAAGTGEDAPGGCSRWGPETSTRWFSGTEGSQSGRRARGSSKAVLSGKHVDTHIQTVCTDQIRFACGRFSQSPSLRLSRRETPYWDSPRLIFCRRGRRSEARWRRQRGRPFLLEGWRLICREPRKRKGRGRKNAPHSKHRCFSSENNWRRLKPPAETRVTQSRTPVELSWWIAMMWIIVNVLKKWEKKA